MNVVNKILDIAKEGHDKIALKQYIVKLERQIADLTSENEKLRIKVDESESPEFEPYPDGIGDDFMGVLKDLDKITIKKEDSNG